MTISSPTPRLRRHRPSSSSLSPPWVPLAQNAWLSAVSMKVPPASTYRSRIANEVASSVAVPKCMVPRLSEAERQRMAFTEPKPT